MGRGRAKAKQAKVARELKYRTPPTDLDALERELAGKSPGDGHGEQYHDPYDPYDTLEDPYEDEDEGEDEHRS